MDLVIVRLKFIYQRCWLVGSLNKLIYLKINCELYLFIIYLRTSTSGKVNSITNLCAQSREQNHLPGHEPIIQYGWPSPALSSQCQGGCRTPHTSPGVSRGWLPSGHCSWCLSAKSNELPFCPESPQWPSPGFCL